MNITRQGEGISLIQSWTVAILAIGMLAGAPWLRAEELSPDSERILQVVLDDGTVVSDSLLAFEASDTWWLPLDEFSAILGLQIRVSPALSQAEGNILSENRRFRLDLRVCAVEIEGVPQSLEKTETGCRGALSHGNDIYVDARLLARWFPLEIAVERFRSQIVLKPKEMFPLQLRRERDRQAESLKYRSTNYDPGYPRAPDHRAWLEGPFVDQQLTMGKTKYADGTTSSNWASDTSASGEVLGFESRGFLSAQRSSPKTWRLSLARRDPDAGLLGPLAATEIVFMDIGLPQLPLVNATRFGRGLLVSNAPLNQPNHFGVEDFRGNILPGWEVELYQNGILLDRKIADASGQYVFERVPLFYGLNQFRFVFYGPQGQTREEFKTYTIDSSTVLPNHQYYRLALIAQDARPDATVQFEKSLSDSLFASVALSQLNFWRQPDALQPQARSEVNRYGYLGLTGFADNILLAGSAVAQQNGGRAYQTRAQLPFRAMTLGARYAHLNSFRSDLFNKGVGQKQEQELGIELTGTIPLKPSIGTTWEAVQKRFEADYRQNLLNNRLSTVTGPLYWNHVFSYTTDNAPIPMQTWSGKLDSNYLYKLSRFRAGAEYGATGLTAVEVEAQLRAPTKLTLTATARHELPTSLDLLSVNVSKLYPTCNIGSSLSVDSQKSYSISALISFSLEHDSIADRWQLDGEPQSGSGAASVLAFRDDNQNGIHDTGESPVKGLGLRLNQRDEMIQTDEAGRAFIPRLQGYAPTDLSTALLSLDDPMLRPAQRGFRFYPRPGKTTPIYLPIISVGEVDGSFSLGDGFQFRSMRALEIDLVDAMGATRATVSPDREGHFYFEEIPPGTYELVPRQDRLKAEGASVSPSRYRFTIPERGTIISDVKFVLSRSNH